MSLKEWYYQKTRYWNLATKKWRFLSPTRKQIYRERLDNE